MSCGVIALILWVVIFISIPMVNETTIGIKESAGEIQRLTFDSVDFEHNGKDTWLDLNKYNVNVCIANDQYSNMVVMKTEEYIRQWLFDLHGTRVEYTVYLDEDLYNRYLEKNILYDEAR